MKFVLIVVGLLLTVIGCSGDRIRLETDDELIETSYAAVDGLLANAVLPIPVGASKRILVTTLADLSFLGASHSTAFGKVLSEQMASRLVQSGYSVPELKLRTNLFISEKSGETLLSRKVTEISAEQGAEMVLIGTYSPAGRDVFVNLKLIQAKDARVISAYNLSIRTSKGSTVDRLLKSF